MSLQLIWSERERERERGGGWTNQSNSAPDSGRTRERKMSLTGGGGSFVKTFPSK